MCNWALKKYQIDPGLVSRLRIERVKLDAYWINHLN